MVPPDEQAMPPQMLLGVGALAKIGRRRQRGPEHDAGFLAWARRMAARNLVADLHEYLQLAAGFELATPDGRRLGRAIKPLNRARHGNRPNNLLRQLPQRRSDHHTLSEWRKLQGRLSTQVLHCKAPKHVDGAGFAFGPLL